MREIVAYHAKLSPDGLNLSRCDRGLVYETTVTVWQEAIEWLTQDPAGNPDVFTVCFNLQDFTKVLFSLLPTQERDQIERQTDRIYYEFCKVFYVNGRYLGLTATIPEVGNIVRKQEINLQALKWWVSEDEEEPQDVKAVWELGTKIVSVLDGFKFYPTKLTSPVSVFQDCYLGDSRKYPTIWSWPEDKFEAMEYCTEMMRYEWRSAYQVGKFDNTHLYDLTSAYPAVIYRLPDTNNCQCEYGTERPEWATWGIMYGEVEVNADVSPLVYDMGDGMRINPRGRWKSYFTTREVDFLRKWGIGSFKLEDGWFFKFDKWRPYRDAMLWLYALKNQPDKFVSTIAKKMSQGVSGKLDEDRQDGKKGDLYNPILACMVRSETRLAVAEFIYQNKLTDSLLAVLVDSVLATRQIDLTPVKGMGNWRYEGVLPAIVLSKGNIWRPGKKPQGIGYDQLLSALTGNPESGYYEFKTASGSVRSIDLMLDGADLDRNFESFPECGGDILTNVYKSTAIVVS